jgi:hypothetical protein
MADRRPRRPWRRQAGQNVAPGVLDVSLLWSWTRQPVPTVAFLVGRPVGAVVPRLARPRSRSGRRPLQITGVRPWGFIPFPQPPPETPGLLTCIVLWSECSGSKTIRKLIHPGSNIPAGTRCRHHQGDRGLQLTGTGIFGQIRTLSPIGHADAHCRLECEPVASAAEAAGQNGGVMP